MPRLPLFLDELERARADRLGDLLERVGLGDPLGHHERHVRRQLTERIEHQRERRFELDGKAVVAVGGDRVDRFQHLLAERVALGPALDRGGAIGGAHLRAVMPFETGAQREMPGELVVADRPLVDHLRLRLEILIEREQRIEDEIAEIASDIGGRPDRVDASEIGLRDEAQRLRRRLRPAARAEPERHRQCQDGEPPATRHHAHDAPLFVPLRHASRVPPPQLDVSLRRIGTWPIVSGEFAPAMGSQQ
jgi:hypothetical protein